MQVHLAGRVGGQEARVAEVRAVRRDPPHARDGSGIDPAGGVVNCALLSLPVERVEEEDLAAVEPYNNLRLEGSEGVTAAAAAAAAAVITTTITTTPTTSAATFTGHINPNNVY